jgi:hypothetical protein
VLRLVDVLLLVGVRELLVRPLNLLLDVAEVIHGRVDFLGLLDCSVLLRPLFVAGVGGRVGLTAVLGAGLLGGAPLPGVL